MIQSDIKILDELLALNLSITIWSARKKMCPEDLGGAELPPEDLASLGSKRVADPEKLRIFNTLKSRAFCFLDRHGVRFMSGWAIPEEKAGMIVDELCQIRDKFFAAKTGFLADYEDGLEEWLIKHQEWAAMIRESIVSADYVRARLDFRWQLYKVAPLAEHADQKAVLEAGLAEEVTGLGGTLFGEVARSADDIWRKVYADKLEVTHKALSPLRTLAEKLRGLSFIEPHVAPVVEIIDASLKRMPAKGNIGGTDLLLLQGLVNLLRDSNALVLHAQKLIEGASTANMLADLSGFTQELCSAFPGMDEPIATETVDPAIGNTRPMPEIASMGLW